MITIGIACCDEKRLPGGSQGPPVMQPNRVTLPDRNSQVCVTVARPCILRPNGIQTGTVWARHGTRISTPATAAELRANAAPYPYGAILPYPGVWYLLYDSASALEFVVLDTACTVPMDGYSVPTHTAPVVGAGPASTAGLAANHLRRYALFINDSNNAIYLALGVTAVVNTGILLEPSGSHELTPGPDGNLWRGAVNFISSLAADRLLVTEGT